MTTHAFIVPYVLASTQEDVLNLLFRRCVEEGHVADDEAIKSRCTVELVKPGTVRKRNFDQNTRFIEDDVWQITLPGEL